MYTGFFTPRQIFDNPEEGLDVLMQIVIVGMLSYTVYTMLFPEGQGLYSIEYEQMYSSFFLLFQAQDSITAAVQTLLKGS